MQLLESSFLHPNPNGWYVIERADQLKKGQIISKKFAGQDIVVFRLENGQACASTAFCPHLGAHLGFGGSIAGDNIRCPTRKEVVQKRVTPRNHHQKLNSRCTHCEKSMA